jgi:hypothetical protein
LRFSPSSGLGFLDLLPPTFSASCCRHLIVENTSYINVPGTQILTFRYNIDFCVFILFLDYGTLGVALLKVAYYRHGPIESF